MINKILVGIDDSEHAEKMLRRARELQKNLGSELVVFHSIEHKMIPKSLTLPRPPFGPASVYRIPQVDYNKLRQEYIDRGKKILEKAAKIVGTDEPKVETRLITELKPEDYAITVAEKENFDLIMMGQKGDHNILERLIGSVAEKVLYEAKCDVMIVK
ncbi:MAG: universal stress protein [Candidatus Lokiarchaeota archaeon]|nr:universal stress protein [Candidatus Lokiarchaeota archaeon]